MGWGCNKHEIDEGSVTWNEKLESLVEREEKRRFPTWGRHGQICPFCFEEMEARLAAAEELIDKARPTGKGKLCGWCGGFWSMMGPKHSEDCALAARGGEGK